MAPVATLKRVAAVPPQPPPGAPGSQFGSRNGFRQRATMGTPIPPPATVDEFDGLNASAVADVRTVKAARLQMREKNVGRFVLWTVTVTVGLIPKLGSPVFG